MKDFVKAFGEYVFMNVLNKKSIIQKCVKCYSRLHCRKM